MKIIRTIYRGLVLLSAVGCIVAATGCGGKKPYRIDGTIEGLGTQNVTAIYHDGAALREVSTNAVNSVFHLEGMSQQPVVIEFYDNQRRRIGCIAVKNGDDVKVKFKAGDRYFMESSGNKLSEALAEFLMDNDDDLNAAIERRIMSAPEDELSVLLAGYYYDITEDAVRADSILSLLDNSAIAGSAMLRSKADLAARSVTPIASVKEMRLLSVADSMMTYRPSEKSRTLYIFTDTNKMADSIVAYSDSVARDMRVATIRVTIDTFGWHNDTRRISEKADHFWAPGGVANRELRGLGIPRLPYFIVADTAANQIYRGTKLPVITE